MRTAPIPIRGKATEWDFGAEEDCGDEADNEHKGNSLQDVVAASGYRPGSALTSGAPLNWRYNPNKPRATYSNSVAFTASPAKAGSTTYKASDFTK